MAFSLDSVEQVEVVEELRAQVGEGAKHRVVFDVHVPFLARSSEDAYG